jgi:hypothetical protein
VRWQAILFSLAVSACAAGGGGTPLTGPGAPSDEDLMFEMAFDLGNTGFARGDSITIVRLLGDRPLFEKGGWYQVQGEWKLGSREEAELILRCNHGVVVGDTHRYVRRGSGTFAVTFRLDEVGFLHASYYARGSSFGGTYFGQGETVYRGDYVPGPQAPPERK